MVEEDLRIEHPPAQEEPPPPVGKPPATAAGTKKPRRFQCMRCKTRFARLEHLQRHERIHTQEKPFCCSLCDHRFTRSDLLIRHERISHSKTGPRKRDRASRASKSKTNKVDDVAAATPPNTSISQSPTAHFDGSVRTPLASTEPACFENYPLATLSMAAEQAALEMPYGAAGTPDIPPQVTFAQPSLVSDIPDPAPPLSGNISGLDFEASLDQLASFLDNGALSSYHFSSLLNAEQPMPLFSPESIVRQPELAQGDGVHDISPYDQDGNQAEEHGSFSRFGSRLPSLQPEEEGASNIPQPQTWERPLSDISLEDRKDILSRIGEFASVIHLSFQLPSRLALSRYVAGYINGFHEHLPFLHVPSMSIRTCPVELILAMAAVGAQYCFEGEKGVELFYVSQAIGIERIRRRDANLAALHRQAEHSTPSAREGPEGGTNVNGSFGQPPLTGPLGLPSQLHSPSYIAPDTGDLMQTAQALLILMAMATWAKHKVILREALAMQSILASLVRDDGLKSQPIPADVSWDQWIQIETVKRTKFIIYCFFNLHCIVYNIPSLLLNSEVNLSLPCSAAEFKAPTWSIWVEARKRSPPETNFQEALNRLFTRGGNDVSQSNSSLGNYILIHAIIQHIFFLRQVARGRFNGNRDMSTDDTSSVELSLRNWQTGWKRNPESSLNPQDPNGPVAFNSTALLRLAYIRLNIDIGPGHALDTRDPYQVARAFRESPQIKRTPKLVRAVLHSAHALSIPVKIGIRLVAQTQTFIWSIQHSICSLECAFLLSKWLEALSVEHPDPPVSDDERRIGALVKAMLDETEFSVRSNLPLESPAVIKQMNAGMMRVWAKIFKGGQTWAIVDVIGSSLNIYADMLDAC